MPSDNPDDLAKLCAVATTNAICWALDFAHRNNCALRPFSDCGVHDAQVYAIGIPGAILLCLGVPVSTLAIMLSIRKRLRQPRTTATFGFLYHQFKCGPRRLVDMPMLNHLTLTLIPTLTLTLPLTLTLVIPGLRSEPCVCCNSCCSC